jgi:hypothetical protein
VGAVGSQTPQAQNPCPPHHRPRNTGAPPRAPSTAPSTRLPNTGRRAVARWGPGEDGQQLGFGRPYLTAPGRPVPRTGSSQGQSSWLHVLRGALAPAPLRAPACATARAPAPKPQDQTPRPGTPRAQPASSRRSADHARTRSGSAGAENALRSAKAQEVVKGKNTSGVPSVGVVGIANFVLIHSERD